MRWHITDTAAVVRLQMAGLWNKVTILLCGPGRMQADTSQPLQRQVREQVRTCMNECMLSCSLPCLSLVTCSNLRLLHFNGKLKGCSIGPAHVLAGRFQKREGRKAIVGCPVLASHLLLLPACKGLTLSRQCIAWQKVTNRANKETRSCNAWHAPAPAPTSAQGVQQILLSSPMEDVQPSCDVSASWSHLTCQTARLQDWLQQVQHPAS